MPLAVFQGGCYSLWPLKLFMTSSNLFFPSLYQQQQLLSDIQNGQWKALSVTKETFDREGKDFSSWIQTCLVKRRKAKSGESEAISIEFDRHLKIVQEALEMCKSDPKKDFFTEIKRVRKIDAVVDNLIFACRTRDKRTIKGLMQHAERKKISVVGLVSKLANSSQISLDSSRFSKKDYVKLLATLFVKADELLPARPLARRRIVVKKVLLLPTTLLLIQAILQPNVKKLHQFVNKTKLAELDPKLALRNTLRKLSSAKNKNNSAITYLKRVIAGYSYLERLPYYKTKLNQYELLRISLLAEQQLCDKMKANLQLKATEVGLARSVLVDFERKSYTIIQGIHGSIWGNGGYGKVRQTIEVTVKQQGSHFSVEECDGFETARKTLFAKVPLFQEDEISFEGKYGDLRTFVSYTKGSVMKETITFKAYPQTVENLLEKGRTPLKVLYALLDQVSATLEKMHSDDVIHGDVKAANILFQPPNHFRLADFGGSYEIGNCQAVRRSLTPLIVSPEFITGELPGSMPQFHKAQDLFALGVLLYPALTLQNVPWEDELQKWYERRFIGDPQSPIKRLILEAIQGLDKKHPFTPLVAGLLNPEYTKRVQIREVRQMLAAIQCAPAVNKSSTTSS